jgi:colanic acid/amylovoran biosynthesis glycosyltransferase
MNKKICFVLGSYPVLSHPFLYNQILEVVNTPGYDVQIAVFNRTTEKVHQAYTLLDEKVVAFPMGSGMGLPKRIKLTVGSFFALLFSRPVVLFKALNFFAYGTNASNGNYLILANHFRKINADVIHCHFGTTARTIADLKAIGAIKAPMLSSFHGMDITVFPKTHGKEYYTRLFKVSEMFTGNSAFIINKMYETGCPAQKTHKIPECINIDQFEYRGEAPKRTVLKIFTVGRFVEKKGYEYSLKAVALLKKQNIVFQYDIVGEGPLKEKMIALADELGIKDMITFHGGMKQEELKNIYSASHIFLLPSVTAANGDTEGQGLVLQEAQAIGVPVLATLHNGFPDSIIDGKTGYLVPEKDPVALFEKLVVLNNDENLCAEMGRLGRKFVEESFDSKTVVKDLIKLYNVLH